MSFEIRTTCPNNNPYYIRQVNGGYNGAVLGSPTKAGANVLANCVGYANGRFAEIQNLGYIKYQLVSNAENFIEHAREYGLEIVDRPSLGGIMVWQKGSLASGDGAGHVAIVERIDSDNQIYTSESGYKSFYFANMVRKNTNGNWGLNSPYTFRGCIVNPAIGYKPFPDVKPITNDISGVQTYLNQNYNSNLDVDGLFGPQTLKALVKAYQEELNKQFGARLVVDGIFGPATKKATVTVQFGARGSLTRIIQGILICRGYDTNGFDGIYGRGTENAVKKFQSNNRLYADGIFGPNTAEKLFK